MYLINLRNFMIMYQDFKTRFFLIISILILLTTSVNAQPLAILTGRVMNMEMNVVEKAKITVKDVGYTYSDQRGYFEIRNIPFGASNIVITADGYETDITDVSIYQRNVEFVTTLHLTPVKEEPVKIVNETEFPSHGNIYGLSGGIELPDLNIFPEKTYNLTYNVFRSKNTESADDQTLAFASFGGNITKNLEGSVFTREMVSKTGATAPWFSNIAGFQIKYRGEYKISDTHKQKFIIGGRNYNSKTDEIFIAFDIPFLNDQKLTLVPIFNTGLKKTTFNIGYEKKMYSDDKYYSSFIVEALQSENQQFKKFNTGFRFKFMDHNSLNLFYMSDTDKNLRSIGVGASMLFK